MGEAFAPRGDRFARVAPLAAWLAILLVLAAAAVLMGQLRAGTPRAVEGASWSQEAMDGIPGQGILLQERGAGRFRLTWSGWENAAKEEARLRVVMPPGEPPRWLMLRRAGAEIPLEIDFPQFPEARPVLAPSPGERGSEGERLAIPLPPLPSDGTLRLTIRPARGATEFPPGGKVDLREMFLARQSDDGAWRGGWIRVGAGLAATCPILFWIGIRRMRGRWRIRTAAAGAFALSLAVSAAGLMAVHDPGVWRDMRHQAAMTAEESPEGNLKVSLTLGSHLLRGEGLVMAPGVPPWHRMPGDGLLAALALRLARSPTDFIGGALNLIALHAGLLAAALGAFAAAACAVWPAGRALAVTAALAFLPSQLHYPMVDGVMPALALGVLAAGLRLTAGWGEDGAGGGVRSGVPPGVTELPWTRYLPWHGAMAAWVIFRPEALPGWVAISAIWHLRRPRLLLMPIVWFLLATLPWAWHKQAHGGPFGLTTSSSGAAAMVGLWETPHPLIWRPSDHDYHRWMKELGVNGTSPEGSARAARESLRFWLTFPGRTVYLVLNKFNRFWQGEIWSGAALLPKPGPALTGALAAIPALALAVGYQRVRTLLLAWPLGLVAPLFFLVYSGEGRFYNTAALALVAAALGLALDGAFYRRLGECPGRAALAALLVGLGVWGAPRLERTLQDWPTFQWSAPWLDPADSSLYRPGVAPSPPFSLRDMEVRRMPAPSPFGGR
ncbi:MAG: hypothetical protein HQL51_05445 [Magnetococcales bacterium]|nr:hypothetical protein [Magnetococcales bacterium]